MQITEKSTLMAAGLSIWVDPEGCDHCVTVIKGTFNVATSGAANVVSLAEQQEPLVYADVHQGDPEFSSIKYECDFAPSKNKAEIVINGSAYTPLNKGAQEVLVLLECGSIHKQVRVSGDRYWERGLFGKRPSTPEPFLTMPLQFERAFGGQDYTHEQPGYHGVELRNPLGLGFRRNPAAVVGTKLPNLEYPSALITEWNNTPAPAAFGCVGRSWLPRYRFAGTYDNNWRAKQAPFLPRNFDVNYFLYAPEDQQLLALPIGEVVRCKNMTPELDFYFRIPQQKFKIRYIFWQREHVAMAVADTLIIEPDQYRFMILWRASVSLIGRLGDLHEVIIEEQ